MEEMQGFENKILNMDCLDFLKKCPDNYFSLVLTDPPYGIGVNKKTVIFDGTVQGKGFGARRSNWQKKDWDDAIPQKEIFDEIFRVSKNQIIWGGNYFAGYLHNSSCWIVWDKDNGTNDFADCELAYTNFSSAVRKYLYRWNGCLQGNIKEKEIRIHPTQKPLPLFQWCLGKYSKEGDLILDCFSGSGTTAVACHNLKRRFICIEKDPEYWAASVKRLEDHQRQLTLF
jgi:site-specific DNA-methyltransferase (adenine-specific)